MAPAKKTQKKSMSPQHKAALAEGRAQGRAIRKYLEALEANKPKRGRKRTPASMRKKIAAISEQLESADPLKKVQLIQERMDLENELAASERTVDLSALEKDFVKYAKGYSERKRISYAAWRELGVAPATLSAAGIKRGS